MLDYCELTLEWYHVCKIVCSCLIAMSLKTMKATVMQSWEMLFLFAFNVPDTNCYFQFTNPENSPRLFTSHTGSFFFFFLSLHLLWGLFYLFRYTQTILNERNWGTSWYLMPFSYRVYYNTGLWFAMINDDSLSNDGHWNSKMQKPEKFSAHRVVPL